MSLGTYVLAAVAGTVTPSPTPSPTATATATATATPGPELAKAAQLDSLFDLIQTLGTVVAVGLAICILLLAVRVITGER